MTNATFTCRAASNEARNNENRTAMNLRIYFFLLAASLTSLMLHAQDKNISGRLVDEQQQPVEYANVVLLSLPDSAFVAGVVSDAQGAFQLTHSGNGSLLRISCVGFAELYRNVEAGHLGTLTLSTDSRMLSEVTVKGDLPKTRLKGDAMITTVTGSVLEQAGTAENLLDKIPNVTAKDGEVNVFGRGAAEVYINGRKVRNSSELDQLSSDNIKQVEVVTNPGARYDASVKAVVRIVTKKVTGEGFGFNNRLYMRNDRYAGWAIREQYNFNYRHKGFDLSGMLYGNDWSWGQPQNVSQVTHLDKEWEQHLDVDYKGHSKTVSGQLALNYQFNPNHSMGVRYDYQRDPSSTTHLHTTTDVLTDGVQTDHSVSHMRNATPETKHTLNYYYNGQIGQWNIDFNADGYWNFLRETQRSDETAEQSGDRVVHTYNRDRSSLQAAKLVVSCPLWQGNLAFGGEYASTRRTSRYRNPEGLMADNDSRINELTAAGFVEYSRSFGKVSAQAGLRYEHVDFDYYERDVHMDEQSRTYDNLFPSLNVNIPVGKVQMQLTYAGKVTRPSYSILRDATTYINRYTYQTGNPFLRPTMMQNLSVAASYQWVNLYVGYSHVKDDINQMCVNYSDEDPTIGLLNWFNLDAYDQMAASLTLAPTIGPWRPQFIVQMQKQWYSMETHEGRVNLNHPIATFAWYNSLTLPGDFLLDVDGYFTTKGHSKNMYSNGTFFLVNMALTKSFLKERLTAQFRANNLFENNSSKFLLYSGIRQFSGSNPQFRGISLNLTYKFNTARSKYKGTGAGQDQKSRM